MSWFAEDRIEIDYVLPPVDWRGKNPEKSDHNAWVSAFARPDKKLLCSWHVDRSWRRKINELIN